MVHFGSVLLVSIARAGTVLGNTPAMSKDPIAALNKFRRRIWNLRSLYLLTLEMLIVTISLRSAPANEISKMVLPSGVSTKPTGEADGFACSKQTSLIVEANVHREVVVH
jgi:hypothetical protein